MGGLGGRTLFHARRQGDRLRGRKWSRAALEVAQGAIAVVIWTVVIWTVVAVVVAVAVAMGAAQSWIARVDLQNDRNDLFPCLGIGGAARKERGCDGG